MSEHRGQSDDPPQEEAVKMQRRAIELAARWRFASPDGKPEHEHYIKYANRILNELPPEQFPPAHPSVMYLRGVAESGLVPLGPMKSGRAIYATTSAHKLTSTLNETSDIEWWRYGCRRSLGRNDQ